jgi:hypothetical protein
MSNNNYREDHTYTDGFKPLLDNHFYPFIAKDVIIRRFDGESPHDLLRQRELKMDLEATLLPYVWHDIEEKVVRPPQDGKPPHTAFYYETESCSLPGIITPGWMRDSKAQCLLYAFEIAACGLDIYFSRQFQEIKSRFWCEMKKNPNCFCPHRNPDKNQTQGRLVPIGYIIRHFTKTERYFLHLDGTCERVDFKAVLEPLDVFDALFAGIPT